MKPNRTANTSRAHLDHADRRSTSPIVYHADYVFEGELVGPAQDLNDLFNLGRS